MNVPSLVRGSSLWTVLIVKLTALEYMHGWGSLSNPCSDQRSEFSRVALVSNLSENNPEHGTDIHREYLSSKLNQNPEDLRLC